MISQSYCKVGKFAIIRDVRVDGKRVLSLITKIIEKLSNALCSILVFPEWVNDPNLARINSSVK